MHMEAAPVRTALHEVPGRVTPLSIRGIYIASMVSPCLQIAKHWRVKLEQKQRDRGDNKAAGKPPRSGDPRGRDLAEKATGIFAIFASFCSMACSMQYGVWFRT